MKYPRTPHLPFSPGGTSDDQRLQSLGHLRGREVVITEKLDGEQISMYSNAFHCRSEDSGSNQPWRSHVRDLHSQIAHEIPEGFQVVGENMYACHSIPYTKLTSWFYVFMIFDHNNEIVLSVDETMDWCQLLGLQHTPVIYRGSYSSPESFETPSTSQFGLLIEGYVVRAAEAFPVDEFKLNVAKWVRPDHVQTDQHWTRSWHPNALDNGVILKY